ncbi:MAG: signal peptidase I [Flavobacteriales bacterium]|nr:MAG: signal peptidase I [Flavobacteriales bacterium]
MKLYKFIIGFAVVFGLPCAFLIVARLTGGLQWYTISSSSGAPNLMPGDRLFATAWREPVMLDLVMHKSKAPTGVGEVWVQRLCGMPGDSVVISNGRLLVNGQDVDVKLRLELQWKAHISKARGFEQRGKTRFLLPSDHRDTVLFLCDELQAAKVPGVARALITAPTPTQELWERAQPEWHLDSFGPLVVPDDSVFVLGDSRYGSLDSRYFGFIAKADIVGVALDARLRPLEP